MSQQTEETPNLNRRQFGSALAGLSAFLALPDEARAGSPPQAQQARQHREATKPRADLHVSFEAKIIEREIKYGKKKGETEKQLLVELFLRNMGDGPVELAHTINTRPHTRPQLLAALNEGGWDQLKARPTLGDRRAMMSRAMRVRSLTLPAKKSGEPAKKISYGTFAFALPEDAEDRAYLDLKMEFTPRLYKHRVAKLTSSTVQLAMKKKGRPIKLTRKNAWRAFL